MKLPEVRSRDLWRCAKCGSPRDLHIHHRRMRSQGGTDTFANLVTLCAICHEWVHHNPALAMLDGWLLFAGTEPDEVPVRHFAWMHKPMLLANDGTVSFWAA